MTIYVSSDNKWAALYFKEALQRCGHIVVSTWHDKEPWQDARHRTGAFYTHREECEKEMERANVLVIVVSKGGVLDEGPCFCTGLHRVIRVGPEKVFLPGPKILTSPDDVVKELIG